MRQLNVCEVGGVSGGFRMANLATVGRTVPPVTSVCYTVQVGPGTSQTCFNSDNTKTVQTCLTAGPAGTVAGMGLGLTGQVCSTTTTTTTGGGYSGAGIGGNVSSGSSGSSHFG